MDSFELLKQVRENPTDIESRLVYADLLTEQGNPRGAFIAQHCQLEKATGFEDGYPTLLASTRRLEAKYRRDWLALYLERCEEPFERQSAFNESMNAIFRHGFLHRIAGSISDVVNHWDWIREHEPIQGMELILNESLPSDAHDLTQPCSWRTLKVSPQGWFTANSVGDVLRWGFDDLHELDLSGCDLGPTGCRLLANLETDLPEIFAPWAAPAPLADGMLRTLALHGCRLGDEGAVILFEASTLSALRTLDISQCQLTHAETLSALRDSSAMTGVRELSLAGNKDLGGKLSSLAGWSATIKLERLALPQSTTREDLEALFPSVSESLVHLDLSSAKPLLKSPEVVMASVSALLTFDIGSTRVGDKSWQTLLASKPLETLTELKANSCSLSDEALDVLAASSLSRLVSLDVSSNKLTDAGLEALVQWPGLAQLTHLRVGNNRKLTATSFSALCEVNDFHPLLIDVGKQTDPVITEPLRERFGDALVVSS